MDQAESLFMRSTREIRVLRFLTGTVFEKWPDLISNMLDSA